MRRGRAHGHEVSLFLPDEAVVVDADPLRLDQIVGNLLDNAVKYTPLGGAIRVSVARDGGAGVVRVRDEGVGIEPALLPRMFEPFVQPSRTPRALAAASGSGSRSCAASSSSTAAR